MLWIFVAIVLTDVFSAAVSIPAWAYVLYAVLAVVLFLQALVYEL